MTKTSIKVRCYWFKNIDAYDSLIQFNIDYVNPYYVVGMVDLERNKVNPISSPINNLSTALSFVFEKLREFEVASELYPELKEKKNLIPYSIRAEKLAHIIDQYDGALGIIYIYGNKRKYPQNNNFKTIEEKVKGILEEMRISPMFNDTDEILFDDLLQEEINSTN